MSEQNGTPPGFVYFQTNAISNKEDTPDYLAFSDNHTTSPMQSRFKPSSFSSPQKFQKSPRNYNNRQNFRNNRYSGGNNSNRSYNSSNNSFNSNASQNNSWKRGENKPYKRTHSNCNNQNDLWKYFEPTCLKDPWEALERYHDQKQAEQRVKENQLEESKQNDDLVEGSSSSRSSSSESEEET